MSECQSAFDGAGGLGAGTAAGGADAAAGGAAHCKSDLLRLLIEMDVNRKGSEWVQEQMLAWQLRRLRFSCEWTEHDIIPSSTNAWHRPQPPHLRCPSRRLFASCWPAPSAQPGVPSERDGQMSKTTTTSAAANTSSRSA